MPENSSNTAGPEGEPHEDYKDLSVHYYEPEEQNNFQSEKVKLDRAHHKKNIDSFQNDDNYGLDEVEEEEEDREIGIKTTERNPMLMDNDTPGNAGNALNAFVTKVPQ